MEMNNIGKYIMNKRIKRVGMLFVFLVGSIVCVSAQTPVKYYKVKNGKMYIELSKSLSETSLDSFINQFQLQSLALKQFAVTGFEDSLKKYEWNIVLNNKERFIITKPLMPVDQITDPVERMRLIEKQLNNIYPLHGTNVKIGSNRFRNKSSFLIREDSVVVFYLRNNLKANKVMLAGTFNKWDPDNLAMKRTDSGWVAEVKLLPGKHWYKFIVDGEWTIDNDNRLNENDGRGNTNSVFYYTNIIFKLAGYTNAKKVFLAGSFNDWQTGELAMNKTANGWELPVYLADGTHTYRFEINGTRFADPENTDRYPNEFGEFNSVIRIGKPRLFFLKGYDNAKEVVLTGSFNKWRTDELFMKKTTGGWELPYTLGSGNYEYYFRVDGNRVADSVNNVRTNTGEVNSYLIIDANYIFRLKGYSNAKTVFLAGDFNDWRPNALLMKKEGDEWVFSAHLSQGKHLYKFIADGKWIIDPGNKLWEQNELNTGNSVLWIE
jgi:Glycogen recognition site of AMP-activated protein kinase/Carbohydrate-binding module 48 (Isoamylase N-terminal domain)